MAVHDTGLTIIHLPPKWQNAQLHMQMAHLLIWWRRIEAAVVQKPSRVNAGVRSGTSAKLGELAEDSKSDYEEARKKLSKGQQTLKEGSSLKPPASWAAPKTKTPSTRRSGRLQPPASASCIGLTARCTTRRPMRPARAPVVRRRRLKLGDDAAPHGPVAAPVLWARSIEGGRQLQGFDTVDAEELPPLTLARSAGAFSLVRPE